MRPAIDSPTAALDRAKMWVYENFAQVRCSLPLVLLLLPLLLLLLVPLLPWCRRSCCGCVHCCCQHHPTNSHLLQYGLPCPVTGHPPSVGSRGGGSSGSGSAAAAAAQQQQASSG